jgi:hypothetical protein
LSSNTLNSAFPYQGEQHGVLAVRRRSGALNVILSIKQGQFVCGFNNCDINVRFDSGPVKRFSASEPSDHSTTALFISGESAFVAALRKAKVVRIEALFYQEGLKVLEFNVEGFKPQ